VIIEVMTALPVVAPLATENVAPGGLTATCPASRLTVCEVLPWRTPSFWPPVIAAGVGASCAEGLSESDGLFETISFRAKLVAVGVVSPGLSVTGTFQAQIPAVPVEVRRSAPLHAGGEAVVRRGSGPLVEPGRYQE
jgi:hypothetical protein